MTQTEQILAHLKRAPLTPLIALQRYGCFRLAARINDLRMAGHSISTYRKTLSSGKTVAVYRMEGV